MSYIVLAVSAVALVRLAIACIYPSRINWDRTSSAPSAGRSVSAGTAGRM